MESRRTAAFRLLGIPVGSDRAAAARAYRRLARVTHPDVSTDPEAAHRFAGLTAAYRLVCGLPGVDAESAPAVRRAGQGPVPARQATPADQAIHDGGWAFGPGWSVPLPPGAQVRPGGQPYIVAGPVRVRRSRPGSGTEVRDG